MAVQSFDQDHVIMGAKKECGQREMAVAPVTFLGLHLSVSTCFKDETI